MVHMEDTASLVKRYADAARRHGEATEIGDHSAANAAHDVISSTYRELRNRGVDAQRALLPLLKDPSVGVRLWAASHALEFSPDDGEPVLSSIESMPQSFNAFSAKMTLQQWRQGNLRFP
jgi:hypothetical protein